MTVANQLKGACLVKYHCSFLLVGLGTSCLCISCMVCAFAAKLTVPVLVMRRESALHLQHLKATQFTGPKAFLGNPSSVYLYCCVCVCVLLYHNTARRRLKDSSASSGSVWNNLVKCAVAGQVCSALGACHFYYSFTVTVSVYLTCVYVYAWASFLVYVCVWVYVVIVVINSANGRH